MAETVHILEAKAAGRSQRWHLGDWLKQLSYGVIAMRDA